MVNSDASNLLQVEAPMAQQADPQPSMKAPELPSEPKEAAGKASFMSQVKLAALPTSLTIPDKDSCCIGQHMAIGS